MLIAPIDDPLRECGPDSRQARDLRHVGAIEVDPLTGEERSREPGSVPGGGAEPTGGRRVDGDELHVARRGGPGGGERQSHTRARECEEGEQEGGFAIVHASTLADRLLTRGIRLTHGAPAKRGSRNAEGGTEERLFVMDGRPSVPRSHFRAPRF